VSVLVLGAGGLVGGAISALPGCEGLPRTALDIEDDDAVALALDAHRPSAVVNCAAMANVNRCDAEPERAWQLNAEAPGRVAAACARRGMRFVHLSTDYVLTGPDTAGVRLDESARPDPRSTYGRSKRGGELAALAHGALVLRVQWIYGATGRGFFASALARMRAGEPVSLVTDQVGTPTEVGWLAERIRDAARGGPTGVFHLAPAGETSAEGWILAGARALGLREDGVARIRRADLPGAFRPARSCLDSRRFQAAWPAARPRWDALLRAALDPRG
jgi:dTDP-4-dehydrorhamnose reductase